MLSELISGEHELHNDKNIWLSSKSLLLKRISKFQWIIFLLVKFGTKLLIFIEIKVTFKISNIFFLNLKVGKQRWHSYTCLETKSYLKVLIWAQPNMLFVHCSYYFPFSFAGVARADGPSNRGDQRSTNYVQSWSTA